MPSARDAACAQFRLVPTTTTADPRGVAISGKAHSSAVAHECTTDEAGFALTRTMPMESHADRALAVVLARGDPNSKWEFPVQEGPPQSVLVLLRSAVLSFS